MLAMWRRGGAIYAFSDKLRVDVRESARRKAHKRTGLLKASMGSDFVGTNGYNNRVTVWNSAPYAQHVEWPTSGTLKFVRLYGAVPHSAPAQYRWTVGIIRPGVAGYEGHHFMRDGLRIGLKKNRIRI